MDYQWRNIKLWPSIAMTLMYPRTFGLSCLSTAPWEVVPIDPVPWTPDLPFHTLTKDYNRGHGLISLQQNVSPSGEMDTDLTAKGMFVLIGLAGLHTHAHQIYNVQLTVSTLFANQECG